MKISSNFVYQQIPKPSAYGTHQTATVSLPSANQNYFYGVVAIDGAGNRGQVSNLVRIYIREVTTTTDIGMTFRWGKLLLWPYCDLFMTLS